MRRISEAFAVVAIGGALVLGGVGCGGSSKSKGTTTTIRLATVPGVTSTAPSTIPVTSGPPGTVAAGAGFVAESPTGALRIGQKGTRVLALQAKLKVLGFDPGAVDGLFGTNTQTAVKGFQTAKALQADGIAGPLTLAAIDAACQQAACPAG